MTWLFLAAVVAIILGLPISASLGLGSIAFAATTHNISLMTIPQNFFNAMDSFTLLAIPFFIFAGELMNRTGITTSLVKFSDLLIGRLKGGLAQANILASIFFAGLTGAGVADTSALGSILIPAMVKQGFSPAYAAAVTASSSVIGPIIPPSIIMVTLANVVGLPVGGLFAAGILPGIVIGLGLMVVAYIQAVRQKHPYRTIGVSRHEFLTIFRNATYSLVMPIIIVGGIFSGLFTPTEASAIAVVYALIIGFFVTRTLNVTKLFRAASQSARTSSVIFMIIGFAKVFGWAMAMEKFPSMLSRAIISLHLGPLSFLIMANIFLLFMGMIMETGANAILLAPVLLPIAASLGIHPLHFGLIMIVNLNIGLATPPFGVCLFAAAPLAKVKLGALSKAVFPFILVEVVVLFCLSFFPDLVLFIPRLLDFA